MTMHIFQYKGIDPDGRLAIGKMDASNAADLEMRLQKMGLDLVNFKDIGETTQQIRTAGISSRDLITLCFHLEQTSKAGVPILESLEDIRDSSENPRLREVLAAIYEAITGGATLSEAMAAYPSVFSKVFTSLVAAGEESGQIGVIFYHLGENIKWQDEQTSMTKRLLMYPIFLVALIAVVIFFLMTYTVPELLIFIRNTGQVIPPQTKLLIFVSNIFVNYWYLIIALPIMSVTALYIGVKTNPEIHRKVDELKLNIPFIGPILKKMILARLVNVFSIMYLSGITIINCIQAGEKITGNKKMEEAVRHVGVQITDGVTLSNSFASSRLFPPLVLRMVRIGESTGELGAALQNIHYFYTRDVKESIDQLQIMIGPAITIVLGVIIAWVVFSVLGPVYDLISNIDV